MENKKLNVADIFNELDVENELIKNVAYYLDTMRCVFVFPVLGKNRKFIISRHFDANDKCYYTLVSSQDSGCITTYEEKPNVCESFVTRSIPEAISIKFEMVYNELKFTKYKNLLIHNDYIWDIDRLVKVSKIFINIMDKLNYNISGTNTRLCVSSKFFYNKGYTDRSDMYVNTDCYKFTLHRFPEINMKFDVYSDLAGKSFSIVDPNDKRNICEIRLSDSRGYLDGDDVENVDDATVSFPEYDVTYKLDINTDSFDIPSRFGRRVIDKTFLFEVNKVLLKALGINDKDKNFFTGIDGVNTPAIWQAVL